MLLAPGGALGDKVMRRGRGWVIIEESTDEEDEEDGVSVSDSMDLDKSPSADTSRPVSPSKRTQSQKRINDDESEEGEEDESEDEDELDPDADIEMDDHSEDGNRGAGKWRYGEKRGPKMKAKKRGAPTPGKEARKMIRIAVSNQVMLKIGSYNTIVKYPADSYHSKVRYPRRWLRSNMDTISSSPRASKQIYYGISARGFAPNQGRQSRFSSLTP